MKYYYIPFVLPDQINSAIDMQITISIYLDLFDTLQQP